MSKTGLVTPHKRVLVVEEDEQYRVALRACLRTAGCEAKASRALGEAFDFLRQGRYDMLLVGLEPGAGQWREMREALPEPHSELEVVVLASRSDFYRLRRCSRAAGVRIEAKPTTFEEVAALVDVPL